MLIVETATFTPQLLDLLSDDEYRRLQVILANRPTAGALIKGSGGLRKMRWAIRGRGKRGGVRVIYYWAPKAHVAFMLLIYQKTRRDDLSPTQLDALKRALREIL